MSPALSVVPVSCDVSSGGVVAHGYDDPVEQRTDVTPDRAWVVPIRILEDCLMAKRRAQVTSEPALPVLQLNAAGLDIGSAEIWVCVPADRDAAPVRRFAMYTPDLHQLADWLVACRITSVALEATGVYWLPVFEILEARGLQVYLVNPHQLQHVPGPRVISRIANGFSGCIAMVCSTTPFNRKPRCGRYAAICASAARCSNIARPTFSTCRRPCSR